MFIYARISTNKHANRSKSSTLRRSASPDRELGISAPEGKDSINSDNSIIGISESTPANGTVDSLQAARQRIEAAQQAVDAAHPTNTHQYPPAA